MSDDNPLTIAKANSLDELMSRDPLDLVKDQDARRGIVLALRAQQQALARAERDGKKAPSKKAQREVANATLKTAEDLDL